MNKFVFTTMRCVFLRFLEEIEDTKKAFRNHLTLRNQKSVYYSETPFFPLVRQKSGLPKSCFLLKLLISEDSFLYINRLNMKVLISEDSTFSQLVPKKSELKNISTISSLSQFEGGSFGLSVQTCIRVWAGSVT